jgi:hypothetical protein
LASILISSVAIDWKWEDLEAVERLIRCLPPISELIINNIDAKRVDQTKVWKLITILARHTLSAGDTRSFAFISSRSVELLGRKLSDNAEYGNDFATIAPVVLNRSIEMAHLTAVVLHSDHPWKADVTKITVPRSTSSQALKSFF